MTQRLQMFRLTYTDGCTEEVKAVTSFDAVRSRSRPTKVYAVTRKNGTWVHESYWSDANV